MTNHELIARDLGRTRSRYSGGVAAAAQDDHPGTPASAPLPAAAPTSRSRTSAKGAQTRAKLIAAARTLLAGEGFARFSTRNVAALCGISHGMCHYHFQDRTDLIVAVVEDIRGEWITPMETAVDTPAPSPNAPSASSYG